MQYFKLINKVMKYAAPVSASNIINLIVSFFAMLMIAKVGKLELAASALATSTYITLSVLSTSALYAVSILIGKYNATKNYEMISTITWNSIWVSVILGTPAALFLWFANKILLFFGQDPHLVIYTVGYFHYAALTMLPMLGMSIIMQFYLGIGKPIISMITSILRTPITLFLSYACIFGKYGMPKMGLAGVTFAMFIAGLICMLGLLIYMFYAKNIKHLSMSSVKKKFDWQICKMIIRMGFPIGMQFFGELSAMSVATYFMGYFGENALAASQVVSQYSLIVVMLILGLSQALSVLVSECYGKREFELIASYLNAALIAMTSFFVIVVSLCIFMPETLIKPFIDVNNPQNADLVQLTTQLLSLAMIVLFIDGVRNLLSSGLRGLQNSKTPMIIGIGSLWVVSLPACYLAGFTLHGGPIGLRIGFATGLIVSSWILWKHFHLHRVKLITGKI